MFCDELPGKKETLLSVPLPGKAFHLVLPLMLILVLAACHTVPNPAREASSPGIEIRGLIIQNRSFSTVTEVMLLVTRTREFISCWNIPMHGECATTFPLRQYQGNDIEIQWKQGGEEWSTGEFVVELSDRIDPYRPAMVRVTITAAGLAATELIQ